MVTDSVNQLMTTVFVEQPLASPGSEQGQAMPGTLHSVDLALIYCLHTTGLSFDDHGLFMWKVDQDNEF